MSACPKCPEYNPENYDPDAILAAMEVRLKDEWPDDVRDIVLRLQGILPVGPATDLGHRGFPNKSVSAEFGYRMFPVGPITVRAARMIAKQQDELEALKNTYVRKDDTGSCGYYARHCHDKDQTTP